MPDERDEPEDAVLFRADGEPIRARSYRDGEVPLSRGALIVALPSDRGDKNGEYDSADLVFGDFVSRSDDRVTVLDRDLGIEREFAIREIIATLPSGEF